MKPSPPVFAFFRKKALGKKSEMNACGESELP